MKFENAVYCMIKYSTPIKRLKWHFSIYYVEELGQFVTEYHDEPWYPEVDDFLADDWEEICLTSKE